MPEPEVIDDGQLASVGIPEGADATVPLVGRDETDVSALVRGHLPLVRALAGKLFKMRWDNSVPFDEYCQMGAVGLVEAARRYDARHGAQFATFASWRITGAILNGLETATELHQQRAARKSQRAERIESLAGGAAPPGADHSPAAALAHLSEVAIGLAVGFMLEGTGMYADGNEVTRQDGYACLASRQLTTRLRRAVDKLPEQERAVIQGHYDQQWPFVELAARLRLSKGRISQVHRSAVEQLRLALMDELIGFES